jgi:hypothetical protein
MASEIADQIAQLLRMREERLPRVQAEISRWRQVDEQLVQLASALEALRRHPSVSPDDAADLTLPRLAEIRASIADVVDLFGAVEARFSRETVNIGVSGSARVGKSTLLQSISGLADEQIPTGRDIPVTAVRSRIYHSPRTRTAALRLHTEETFLNEVIRPYHAALNFTGVPSSLEQFRAWKYPGESEQTELKAGDLALLVRLREMQQALWSYEKDLGGGEKAVRLEDLRPYVAYPTSEERGSAAPLQHRYLAIRDVRIDCPFPHADVDHLGIIDLPGLGEVAAEAEEHHLTGLRHDVDVVLLVKRAAEGMAYWSAADAQAINLLDIARGFIRNRGDFAFIVINARDQDSALADALRSDIQRQVNDGQADRHFTILGTNAADAASVRDSVLSPLLSSLASRLPVMDEECLSGAQERAADVASGVRLILSEVSAALSGITTTGAIEDLENRAKELREDLAVDLGELVLNLNARATADDDDPGYVAAVDAAYGGVKEWIEDGFGVGEEEWCNRALRSFRVNRDVVHYGGDEMNRIRVEISSRFALLDDFFSGQVEEARRRVGVILQERFGTLLAGVTGGTELLQQAAELFAEASEPCPTLEGALQLLLTLRLEYRTQAHPRVRSQLDGLNIQLIDPSTGVATVVVKDLSAEGARDLFVYTTDQAKQAGWDTKKALLDEKVTPMLVIYAAVEQFEDAFIRSGKSEAEFRRFARSYRDELWPGEFAGLTEGHAHYARVTRLIKTITENLG